jgi:hypothetical protein
VFDAPVLDEGLAVICSIAFNLATKSLASAESNMVTESNGERAELGGVIILGGNELTHEFGGTSN